MVAADLHIHTQNSDGALTLQDLPATARRANISAVAVTDHDRIHPGLDESVTSRDGITIIHGIELRVEAEERVDLLGYAVDPTPSLLGLIDRLQENRITRGAAIIDRVETYLDIELSLDPRPGIGRPHIARAIAAHPNTDYDVQEVFDELIGDDKPCYVPRDIPSFDDGFQVLAEACSVVSLAHPFRYTNPEQVLRRAKQLDAVERWYPYEHDVDPEPIEEIVASYGLLRTGGSDTHDTHVGRAGMPKDAYRAFAERLPG